MSSGSETEGMIAVEEANDGERTAVTNPPMGCGPLIQTKRPRQLDAGKMKTWP